MEQELGGINLLVAERERGQCGLQANLVKKGGTNGPPKASKVAVIVENGESKGKKKKNSYVSWRRMKPFDKGCRVFGTLTRAGENGKASDRRPGARMRVKKNTPTKQKKLQKRGPTCPNKSMRRGFS